MDSKKKLGNKKRKEYRRLVAMGFYAFMHHKKPFILCILLIPLSSNSQALADYINEAMHNNPLIKAKKHEYEVASEKVNEVGSLANTSIGAGYFISEPETRTGTQKARFKVAQSVPWFGTLKTRKQEESSASEIYKNEIAIMRRKITLDVKQKYYQLYAMKARESILKEQKKLLENYKEISLSAVANNTASAIDVLKIDISQNNIP